MKRGAYHRDVLLMRLRGARSLVRARKRINQAARGHLREYRGYTTQEARAALWKFVRANGWKRT